MTNPFASVFNQVTTQDRAFFFRQLSIMVSSGIPFSNALVLAVQQVESVNFRTILHRIAHELQNGMPFSESASHYPELFDDSTISMLRSGEATGQLQQVLADLADHLEREVSFSSRVKNALLYPSFVVVIMIAVGMLMTLVVMPRLNGAFEDSGFSLPFLTRLLMSISLGIIHYWYLILLVGLCVAWVGQWYLATAGGHRFVFWLQSNTPVIRSITNQSYLVRFSSLLGMLIRSGIALPESLRIAGDSLKNQVWSESIQSVRQEVEKGVPLSAAMARHTIFPQPLVQMIGVGEQTGQMDVTLRNMADFYEEQTTNAIRNLTVLIEPVSLVVVSVAVGFVVMAVILPLYGLANRF